MVREHAEEHYEYLTDPHGSSRIGSGSTHELYDSE